MNWVAGKARQSFWARMAETDGRQLFWCNPQNRLSRELCFTGQYEPQETVVVKAMLRPGDTFADVGANEGYYTLLAAHRVGPGGRVISLEPDPRVFDVLRNNVQKNRLSQVSTHPVAASDRDGVMALSGFDEAAGNFGVSSLVAANGTGPTYEVKTRPLDELFPELGIGRIDLLKMDIEGAEIMALPGMAAFLRERCVGRMLLELHPSAIARQGVAVEDVLRPLVDAGYRAWRIDHSAEATRRAAYAKSLSAASVLTDFSVGAPLDEWPHLVWVAPGLELFPA